MENKLFIYNSLSRKKEIFEPIAPPNVGLYVCGPTVYGDAHLGHARPAITFDLLFRYLHHLGYRVRYVRNITDVGHLENDSDDGEDKIARKARLEQVEPMEIVHYYSRRYHKNMDQLNTLPASIEPSASGHIIEQITFIQSILRSGYAYESGGSVYFDLLKFDKDYGYGRLSGRNVEDLLANTRELSGQKEKRNRIDFALWKKASPQHIMRWPSPWSEGFPGWHMECSAMAKKYLGKTFDIHGGGLDLQFPHHESEIAQSMAANKKQPVNYWMHNNMITINGRKMSKSLENFITLDELFAGKHKLLEKAFPPIVIRFFILQAHYRSTLDFSNEALISAEKGLKKLMNGMETLKKLKPGNTNEFDVNAFREKCYNALNDDLNSPVLIAHLFDAIRFINSAADGKASLSKNTLHELKTLLNTLVYDILGLEKVEQESSFSNDYMLDALMEIILEIRKEAKKRKDFETADSIREQLKQKNIIITDTPEGTQWNIQK
ncbi:MAG: cysteine--tRNA ligase [Bacteroidales bacterium]